MDGGHMHDMPVPPPAVNGTTGTHHEMTMMHMTFFWGSTAEILFFGWPGTRTGMYMLTLIFIFVIAVLVEWISHCKIIKPGASNLSAGLVQSFIHGIRVALDYMVMLAIMSFNVGVFLAAVAGRVVGYLIFGSRVLKDDEMVVPYQKPFDIPPMGC